MERFLLLWDELDEFVGIGRHMAATLSHSMASRMRRTRQLLRGLATNQA